MYAKSLHIYDFKCYGKAVLDLQYPSRVGKSVPELKNVNLILGDNGGGKSSVLRALAIATLAPALLESGFVPYRLIRRAKPDAPSVAQCLLKIEAVITRDESFPQSRSKKLELLARLETRGKGSLDRLHLESTPDSPISRLLEDDYSPAFFVVGYGATRRVETGDYSASSARRSRGLRYQRIAGLFEDQLTLRPLQLWLSRLQHRAPQRLESVIELLNRVLPGNIRFTGERDEEDEQYLFLFDGTPTPFTALSDGYKAFIGWVSDLLSHLCDVTPENRRIDEVPGMVLVDEIDLHLHPEWQRSVVPTLATTFPQLQFVFTSHSPLVASTVKRENIFITDTAEDGTATIKQLEEHVFGKSMEQLLLSAYFGLQTTRPDAFKAEDEQLFEKAANGDTTAALDFLARLTHPAPLPASAKGEGKQ
ncbi:AAA family ATPase [Pseudomonas putida]|uniref:AAA family ATPase n=1 Tax=Pseudomonas putida TaxID=303 RepID=UPI00345D4717